MFCILAGDRWLGEKHQQDDQGCQIGRWAYSWWRPLPHVDYRIDDLYQLHYYHTFSTSQDVWAFLQHGPQVFDLLVGGQTCGWVKSICHSLWQQREDQGLAGVCWQRRGAHFSTCTCRDRSREAACWECLHNLSLPICEWLPSYNLV